eukprot:gnl/TRDRNA2_/TRDRNA2_184885_c0_seq1.p1 gnl/TRDRNA2_/TRDRNA2_184885_c0~~gnl/TRDRNA2_/TRDRNA2_184885_c0_seq1.p1  ORF type:complete len:415 (-),score=68.36 gnl/TRDRNA2_/TRDRNA2_184885_c0_seq1:125-1369(-)
MAPQGGGSAAKSAAGAVPLTSARRRRLASLLGTEEEKHVDESRLEEAIGELRREFDASIRDWRRLEPQEIMMRFKGAKERAEHRNLLATAVFVGTAQACLRGKYWSPHASCPGAVEVDCRHLARPSSRLYLADKTPAQNSLKVRSGGVRIFCTANAHPLDAGARVLAACHSGAQHRRVAVVRFSAMRDRRNEVIRYAHCREDQLFLRSTYYQSFENMETEIHAPIGDSLDLGGIIYTPGVAVLRGPIEEGALWFQDPPRVDVIWVAVDPRPRLAEQGQYADAKDRDAMSRAIDRVFAWAAYHEVDTLVMPPVGCTMHGCNHPSLDVADVIYKTAMRYGPYISQVCLASDYPSHFEGGWWDHFTDAVQNGRPAIVRPQKIPVPPYPLLKKDSAALAEKARRLNRRAPRAFRHTFL